MRSTPPASEVAAAPALGSGRYSLTEIIGEGGMSVVYRGWDHRLNVERAIKVLSREAADRSGVLERFRAEASTTARLHHPNIVSALDIVEDGGRFAIVMELVRGGTLWERVERQGPLSEAEAARVLLPVVEAISAAHKAGVVHRDIKPQNILLTERGTPKLSDFGIALVEGNAVLSNLTRTGAVLGTFGYMSPEQRTDASRVSAASDLYALGATLWAVVRGRSPTDLFAADLEPRLLEGLSPPLAELVRDCTRYRVEDRPADADVLAQRLDALIGSLPRTPAQPAPRSAEAPDSSGQGRADAGTLHDLLHDEPVRRPSATEVWQQVRAEHGHVRVEPRPAKRWLPWLLVLFLLGVLSLTMLETVSLGELLAEATQDEVQPKPAPVRSPKRPARPKAPAVAASEAAAAVSDPAETSPQDANPAALDPAATPGDPPEAGASEAGASEAGAGEAEARESTDPETADAAVSDPTLGGPSERDRSPRDPKPAPKTEGPPWSDPAIDVASGPASTPMGRVSLSGPVIDPELEADNGEIFSPGLVPAGHYLVRGAFAPNRRRGVIAEITVEADGQVRLRCDGAFQKCSP